MHDSQLIRPYTLNRAGIMFVIIGVGYSTCNVAVHLLKMC